MSISLAQDGVRLGTIWGKEKAVEMLKEAGFPKVKVKTLPQGFQNYYFVVYVKL